MSKLFSANLLLKSNQIIFYLLVWPVGISSNHIIFNMCIEYHIIILIGFKKNTLNRKMYKRVSDKIFKNK